MALWVSLAPREVLGLSLSPDLQWVCAPLHGFGTLAVLGEEGWGARLERVPTLPAWLTINPPTLLFLR